MLARLAGRGAFLLGALCAWLLPAPSARACGGGVVSIQGQVGADVQRIVLSVRDGTTTVVTQVAVPNTPADYGVIIPVPSRPTLDPEPVPAAELQALDQATAPRLVRLDDSDGGCGCPLPTAGSAKAGSGGPDRVQVSPPVDIGPVTAVTLSADSGSAIAEWLATNGFTVPEAQRSLLDAYAGPGRHFIALRRNDRAIGGATSVGIRFSLAGDERALPLRFARLGAASQIAFTVFVATSSSAAVAPELPFTALTLNDLDEDTLRASGYRAAVVAAVAARNGRAFVLEGAIDIGTLRARGALGAKLGTVLANGQRLTRLTTVVAAESLNQDVALTAPVSVEIPTARTISASRGAAPGALAAGTLLLLLGRRRRRLR
jgi:hypothetical protein